MSKVKMRCARCSKPFKSSDAKQTLCPDCVAKERLARARGATAHPAPAAAKPVHAPKIVGPGAATLGASPVVGQAAPPPDTGAFGAAARRAEQEERRGRDHGHPATFGQHRDGPGTQETHAAPARPAVHGAPPAHDHGAGAHPPARPSAVATKAPPQPRPPRAPRAPKERTPQPQELTPDQREQVEKRYLELAQPAEFNGIRTQIATELGLPKMLVRKAILELRQRTGQASWWDLQGFPGTQSDLERIRVAYAPLLPVPPIGVHKRISEQLGLDPHAVYKGIRQIRVQMGLPQFNPPEEHPEYVQPGAAAAEAATAQPGAGATAE